MKGRPDETGRLIERLRAQDQRALDELFAACRDRLRRMVELRLDWRLRAQVDAAAVLAAAYQDAASRVDEYLREPGPSPLLWLRKLVAERLDAIGREHPGTR